MFYNVNDSFIYEPLPNIDAAIPDNNVRPNPTPPSIQGIALRSLANCDLHKDSKDMQSVPTNDNTAAAIEKEQDEDLSATPKDLPLALRRSHRTTKPSTWLQESLEYLNRLMANIVEDENLIPRTFREAMKRPDL